MSTVGRPREHDQNTAAALLEAAERIVEQHGISALSVRRVAEEIGESTRAVYSVYGSKDALVAALGRKAFGWLADTLDAQHLSGDPVADLVEAGVGGFRRLAIEHPSLYTIAMQQRDLPADLARGLNEAAVDAWTRLQSRMERLAERAPLGRSVREAATQYHALCEGLAAVELRGNTVPGDEERMWRQALTALVIGFTAKTAEASPQRQAPHVARG
jgi:AcrR family transcriptional regulator